MLKEFAIWGPMAIAYALILVNGRILWLGRRRVAELDKQDEEVGGMIEQAGDLIQRLQYPDLPEHYRSALAALAPHTEGIDPAAAGAATMLADVLRTRINNLIPDVVHASILFEIVNFTGPVAEAIAPCEDAEFSTMIMILMRAAVELSSLERELA